MNHPHVHISDGRHEGCVFLGHDGHAHGDGSRIAEFAIHGINHRGLGPEHGKKLLESIVQRLDSASRVSARYCDKPDCHAR